MTGEGAIVASVFVKVLKAHQWVYDNSGGLIGHRVLAGNPTLLLRTVGRKTGQARTSALTYGKDGDSYLVTASNGGSPRAPGWLANLKAKPECEIQVGRRKVRVVAAAKLPDDPDYARLFAVVDKVNKGRYAEYQKKTTREIAVVALTPVG
ncbi:nitroreductase family deazaflavin-dependent oxidoreductase [Nocardia callitridis]